MIRNTELRLAGITETSVVDGPGLRIVIFAQGCPHNCPGCHNTDTHDSNGGYAVSIEEVFSIISSAKRRNKLLRGVTFSGGEPFLQSRELADLAGMIKNMDLNIVTYTGYTFEELFCRTKSEAGIKALLELSDILIDGPYLEKERDLFIAYRGSRNQRLIDVKASLEAGRAVLWEE
jgi:anaerobic ribonucleoside-triphosphate reductase activating protein